MEQTLKTFISAHVVKWNITTIIYNGSLELINKTIDWAIADMWYDETRNDIEYITVWMRIFGDTLTLLVPHFSNIEEKEIEDVTAEYKNLISEYLKSWMFSDRRWAVLFKLLDWYWVCKYKNKYCYYVKDTESFDFIQSIKESTNISIWWEQIDIIVSNINDINRYENLMLLFKEVSDWYYDVRRHSITEKVQWTHIQQEYSIAQDIYATINTQTKEIIKIKQEETKYNSNRKDDWRYVITPDWTEINTKDFKAAEIKRDWDILELKLIWAYTHVLRDLLEFRPITWQYKLLMNFNRLNFIAWCRRSWKTYLSAYIILRELWRMPNSIRHINRQVRWLYIAPTEDKFKEVIDYLKKSSEKIRILKVVDFNKKENRLYLYDEKVARNQKTQITVATCDFSSGKWYEPGRWRASDIVIIDEAAFIMESVRLNILPILENEKARFFAISTIDRTTQRNRFYEQLVEAEKWLNDAKHEPMYWMRVTIDDIDEVLVDDWMRSRMKDALKHDKARYYAELYASLPEVWNVFDTEGFFSLNKEILSGERHWMYVIWYDPAKRSDIWAVIVWQIRMSWAWKSYCHLIEEYELQWEYQNQKQVLANIKDKYNIMSWWMSTVVIIDATQVWDVVAEMFWNIIDYKVWYTAKWTRPSIDNYWAWKIAKPHLVHLNQILIEKWILKSYVWLRWLMDELKNFKAIETASWAVKYEAEVWHDDHVNAMMLIWFFIWYIEWRIYELWIDWQNVVPEWRDPATNLYETNNYRVVRPEQLEMMLWWNVFWFWA